MSITTEMISDAVVDGDDGSTDLDSGAFVHQELGDRPGVRAGQLDQRLAGLHLDENVVDLDLIADGNPPGHDVGLDQSFTGIRQPESLQRHSSLPRQ